MRGEAELPQIADAVRAFGFLLRGTQRGQEHPRQDRDNRNDDEQFDECEGLMNVGWLRHRVTLAWIWFHTF